MRIIFRIMLFWYGWVLILIWHWGIFVKASYVTELFLVAWVVRANLVFVSETWKCKFGTHSFHSLHSYHSLALSAYALVSTSVFILLFVSLASVSSVFSFCLLWSFLWVFFFRFPSKVVKGEYFMRFSWKRIVFHRLNVRLVWFSYGFRFKGCSFMRFLMKREYLYLVSRFRILRKTFICMIFVKSLRFWERPDVLCVGRKMTISTGLMIDWVWKHM